MESSPKSFTAFGEFLKYLRQRAGLKQRELGQAVGYSAAQVARLEGGRRRPDVLAVRTQFVTALGLGHEPELAARLVKLAEVARGKPVLDALVSASLAHIACPSNLPTQLTRFIGREQELVNLRRLLPTVRLLTLTGAGGVGKTRLALEVGASLASASAFPDGVWLAEFAPLAETALVARTVMEVLRLHDEFGRTPTEVLASHIADKHILLILDNCEHVITACAELAEALLRACPQLHILATSREALQVAGEVAWRVPSLATPDPAHLPPIEQVLDYEAIQLFVDHAAASQPAFSLTPGALTHMAHICHRLDGIPLAIEMAASQTLALSVAEIAAGVDDHFALHMRGRPTALPRQRTLHSVLEWSYQLLSNEERLLLARLSVFASGCTASMVQAVCADESLPTSTILTLLIQLVRKSLVEADIRDEGTRYRLLEVVRQFSEEKLSNLGGVDAMYQRLAAYLLSQPEANAAGPVTGSWLDHMETELDNIRALMTWASRQSDDGAARLRLAVAQSDVWIFRGHLTETQMWLDQALQNSSDVPAALRVTALTSQLELRYFRGYNLAGWGASAEELEDLCEHVENPQMHWKAMHLVGLVALHQPNALRASAIFEQNVELARQIHSQKGVCVSLAGSGLVRMNEGDSTGASAVLGHLLQAVHEDDTEGEGHIALLAMAAADHPTVLAEFEREVARRRILGNRETLARMLQMYANLLIVAGDTARAQITLEECLNLWRNLGVQYSFGCGVAQTLLDQGQVAWLSDDYATAEVRYEQCLELYDSVGDMLRIARLHILIGYTHLAQGDYAATQSSFRQGLYLYRELNQLVNHTLALAAFAALAEAQGKRERAARLFATAARPRPMYLGPKTWPADVTMLQHIVDSARVRFGSPKLSAAWAEGHAMTLEQAVAYALRDNEVDEPL